MLNEDWTDIAYKEFIDLIKQHFPDIFIKQWGHGGADFYAEQTTNNYLFRNTKYFYNHPLNFIHWTSLSNLLSILNYKEIRFYNLYNSDDKDEFNYSASALGLTQDEIDFAKKYYYSFSFCEKKDISNPHLWEVYGKKYKGVAIEFSIENDPKKWDNYMMSNVYYEIPPNFTAFSKELSLLKEKYNATFNLHIENLIGFHKKEDYHLENEIRISTYFPYSHQAELFKYVKTDFRIDEKRNRITNYITLPLWEDHDHYVFKTNKPDLDRRTILSPEYFKTHPQIKLTNIHFGNNCGISFYEFSRYKEVIEQMILFNLGYKVNLNWDFIHEKK